MNAALAKALDASAVGLSALCLIHCLALPALALLLPVLGFWAQAEWVHVAFVLIAAPVAVLSFVDLSAGRPHSWTLAMAGVLGLGLMLVGAFGFPTAADERVLTVLGGGLLAGAHIANWRRRHGETRCDAGEHA
jgi:hypothetical protein